jgi:hypothetical protein
MVDDTHQGNILRQLRYLSTPDSLSKKHFEISINCGGT